MCGIVSTFDYVIPFRVRVVDQEQGDLAQAHLVVICGGWGCGVMVPAVVFIQKGDDSPFQFGEVSLISWNRLELGGYFDAIRLSTYLSVSVGSETASRGH